MSYLISIDTDKNESALDMQALLNILNLQGIEPERRDSRHPQPHWIKVQLDEAQMEVVRQRFPSLIIGSDLNLNY